MRFRWVAVAVLVPVASWGMAWGMLSGQAQEQNAAADWALHNNGPKSPRFSPLDQINTSNAGTLTRRWSFDVAAPDAIGPVTPLVVDGVMYFNSGSKLFALDAATGKSLWTVQAADAKMKRGGRGPAYGDGRVYGLAESVIYAVDARTGTPVESFGKRGVVRFINDALAFKYPGKYPADLDPTTRGYRLSAPPTYLNGVLYVGVASSDDLIDGGLLIALDGKTGAVRWVFTTIPQGPGDDGWEIARDTWGYGKRVGGGIWNQPAIDPELGLIYLNAANSSPDYDGTARTGMNLFTNSMIALNAATGKMAWHFQTLHHDLWDKDLTNGPVLFDVTSGGRTVKGIASFGKTCYAYILNRETGQPLNPIVETPVPTATDVPGEQPWPTQPIPYTSAGTPQQPFCATYPMVSDPELAKRVRSQFHPFQTKELIIVSPGLLGGANWGPPSFSPRTGLLYVTGRNDAFSLRVKVVGDTLQPGPDSPGHFGSFSEEGKSGVKPTQSLVAYEPLTGRQAWAVQIQEGTSSTGNLVTAGQVLFHGVGTGSFFAFDAQTGRQLFRYAAKTVSSSPITYAVKGKQYVSFNAGNQVLALALP